MKALLIGVSNYGYGTLASSVNDAQGMHDLLIKNHDESRNFDVKLMISGKEEQIKAREVEYCIQELFEGEVDMALFYFAGHGKATERLGKPAYLVCEDHHIHVPGVSLDYLFAQANASKAREVVIIIDACNSGGMAEFPSVFKSNLANASILRKEMTILAAAKAGQPAANNEEHGRFTSIVLDGLKGSAADLLGHVTAASLYYQADQVLGHWEQRPVFKSNVTRMSPLRKCKPGLLIEELQPLSEYFNVNDTIALSPAFINPVAYGKVENRPGFHPLFDLLVKYERVGLLKPKNHTNLYEEALANGRAKLTPLGSFYRELVVKNRI